MSEAYRMVGGKREYAGYVYYHKDGSVTYGGGKANGNQYGNNLKILGARSAQNPTDRLQRQFHGRKKKKN